MTLPSLEVGRLPIHKQESLARHTSLKVGGPADYFVEVPEASGLAAALAHAKHHGLPVRYLGGGSNLVVAEDGLEGLVVKLRNRHSTLQESGGKAILVAGTGASLAGESRRVSKLGWAGLEWAVNVPGTFGGAAVNNAGAFGSCMAEALLQVVALTPSGIEIRLSTADLGYGYRTSRFKRHEVGALALVEAHVRLWRDAPDRVLARVAENQAQRDRTQPRQLSAGSIFANPSSEFAGRLIEAAGLKGQSAGGAQISDQHANFIVNLGGATPREVYELMRLAQERVWQTNQVWLQPEIELVGRWPLALVEALQGPGAQAGQPDGRA